MIFKIFSSLRCRITLLILLSIIPAIVLFHITNQERRNFEIASTKNDTLKMIKIISNQEGDLVDGARQLLLALSLLNEIKYPDNGECNQMLSAILPHYKRYINFGVADIKGNVICSVLPMSDKVNIYDRKYFSKALNTQRFAIGEFQIGRITKKPSINFGHPVYDDNSNITGIIYAAMDIHTFDKRQIEVQSKLGENSILTKIDSNGIVLAKIPPEKNIVGKPLSDTSIRKEVLHSKEGIIEKTGGDGRNWIYAYATLTSPLFQSEIYMIYQLPEEDLLANINHIYNRNTLIMAMVGFVLLLIAWSGFEFLLMRQIRSLHHSAQRLANGDLSTRSQLIRFGGSEINQLMNAFNNMAASLERRKRDLQEANLELEKAHDAALEGWSRAMDLRDKETEGHTQRVADMAIQLARSLGFDESEILHIRRGALLHDIGKMGVPDYILHKPDKLTREEWAIMRKHPVYAYEILYPIAFLRPALDIPYCHHEKWDGTGYPQGLKGEKIPLAARVFALADVWDALRSDRPYREAWSEHKVREYIKEESGKYFDPELVEKFLEMIE